MSSRAQNDIILYALLGRKITPAPSHKKTVSSRRERNKEYAKVSNQEEIVYMGSLSKSIYFQHQNRYM